jgi:hypothetical protein
LFKGYQQKEVSAYLNILWQQDPFKAKWAVLAKAYSMVRDKVGKNMAPLDKFLRLTCPAIGIIGVTDYFRMLNWDVVPEGGKLTVTQVGQPDLTTFDSAITCCSMTEVDILQHIIDNGYLNEVDGFTDDARNSSEHLMVSPATAAPRPAREAFSIAIHNDPKAVAAQILGLDVNHKFLEISSDQSAATLNPFQYQGLGNFNVFTSQLPSLQHPMHMMGPYQWTGSMSELYNPSEMELDFDAIMADNEWMVTDIGNPVDMDQFLQTAGGYDPNELFPNRELRQPSAQNLLTITVPFEDNLFYRFADSF